MYRLNWFATETMADVFYVELLAQKYSKLTGMFYFYILIQCSKFKYFRTMTIGTATITLVNRI